MGADGARDASTAGEAISFPEGFGAMMRRLAEPLKVRLERVVEGIKYEGKPSAAQLLRSGSSGPSEGEPLVTVTCRTPDRKTEEYVARFTVVTVPLGVLTSGRIAFSPPLPSRKVEAMKRLGSAAVNKVVLHFRSAFWTPTCGSNHVGVVSTSANHSWFFNAATATKSPVLVCLLTGDAARKAEQSTNEQVVTRCVRSLQMAFRPAHVPEPVASYVTRWGSDPFAAGGYSFFAVGSSTADCEALAEPCGWRRLQLGFAGEATTASAMGTVLGAWLSGEAEAQRILKEMTQPLRSGAADSGASGGGGGGGWGNSAPAAAPPSTPSGPTPKAAAPAVQDEAAAALAALDEQERRERQNFIGRGAGAKPEGELFAQAWADALPASSHATHSVLVSCLRRLHVDLRGQPAVPDLSVGGPGHLQAGGAQRYHSDLRQGGEGLRARRVQPDRKPLS